MMIEIRGDNQLYRGGTRVGEVAGLRPLTYRVDPDDWDLRLTPTELFSLARLLDTSQTDH